MEVTSKTRVLFLYPFGYWPANPNCVSLVQRCESDGFSFDLFCPSAPNCRGEGKEISEWVWLVRRIFLSAFKQSFRRPWKLGAIWKSVINFYFLKRRIRNRNYSLVITCDAVGLSLLSQMRLPMNVPIVYLSFHILFRNEIKSKNERALGQREDKLLRAISLILSQDNNRRQLISKELGFCEDQIHCIAVAPENRLFPIFSNNTKRPNEKMILYTGNLEKWNLEGVLEQVSLSIPNGFFLRIHTHFPPHRTLRKKLERLEKQNRLQFSFAFLDEPGLVELIDQSYICLAPYFPQTSSWMVNQTLFHIGKASTKIAYYCFRKKPVITTPLPSLVNALSKHAFGIACEDWKDISSAILKIDSNYSHFSENAYQYFEAELNPSEALNCFWRNTTSLILPPKVKP